MQKWSELTDPIIFNNLVVKWGNGYVVNFRPKGPIPLNQDYIDANPGLFFQRKDVPFKTQPNLE